MPVCQTARCMSVLVLFRKTHQRMTGASCSNTKNRITCIFCFTFLSACSHQPSADLAASSSLASSVRIVDLPVFFSVCSGLVHDELPVGIESRLTGLRHRIIHYRPMQVLRSIPLEKVSVYNRLQRAHSNTEYDNCVKILATV